jgi:hypothetical protein
MKKTLLLASVVAAAFVVAPAAPAADPPPTVPFPSAHSGAVFVAAQTVTADGAMSNYFAPGTTVVFRSYAVDGKTRKVVTKKLAKYFYVKIPNQPNLKFKYTPKKNGASGRYTWTARWNVPSSYPTGIVAFKVVVQTKSKHLGSFVQIPVATSQLTISTTPQTPFGGGPGATSAPSGTKVNVGLYVDSVNGTRPSGAAPRPIGCTQTNVYKRGEQVVIRAWGYELATGEVLSIDNVSEAHFSVPGMSNVPLNWGSHGATGSKVWFWTNAFILPASYPLGDSIITVSFTTVSGKTATFPYQITVIP